MLANLRWRSRVSSARRSTRICDSWTINSENQLVVKIRENFLIAREETAVQQRQDRLGIFGIELTEFGNILRDKIRLQSHILHTLCELLDRFAGILIFHARRGQKKEKIDIRIREEHSPAEIPHGKQYNTRNSGVRWRKKLLHKPKHDRFH